MKNKYSLPLIAASAALITIGAFSIAWQNKDSVKQKKTQQQATGDTTKMRRKVLTDADMKDIDKNMQQLDTAMANLGVELGKIDFGDISKEINAALAQVDFDGINKQVEASVNIAMDEIKKIDWNSIKVEVDKAMAEAKVEIAKIDFNKINAEIKVEMDKVKKEQLLSSIDMQKINKDVKDAISNAKIQIAKAKEQLKMLKEFTNLLEKDGLINKSKPYRIEWKADDLYLNGNKQTKEISDRYKQYKKIENYSIKSDGDDNYETGDDDSGNDKETDSL